MTLLDATPLSCTVWNDTETEATGWLVIRSIVADAFSGGIRMRLGCNQPEVADLAHTMALKAAVFDLPAGGAKGGINFNPQDSRAHGVLRRYVEHFKPWLQTRWVTAEDYGNPQWVIDEVFDEAGLWQSFYAAIRRSGDPQKTLKRVRDGLRAPVPGGYQLGDVIGGFGVAQACQGVANAWNAEPKELTAAVQGAGTMGGGAAYYLDEAGVKVVALSDAKGTLYHPKGLDVPTLLKLRNRFGEIDRSRVPTKLQVSEQGDAVLSYDVDLLVPAAASYAITLDNVVKVNARAIVEAANAAILPRAELMLAARQIPVIPGFVANAGAVAWAWWLLLGNVDDDPEKTFSMVRKEMLDKVGDLMGSGTMPQAAAYQLADRQRLDKRRTFTVP